ncbi:MAG: hypothetical protein ACYSYU_05060 [Planctomycetota bacterium]|jgi:hypothetical protein
MGFGTLEQLIARGRPSPITSAISGFTGTAAAMQNLRKQQLANQIQQAAAGIAPQSAQAGLLLAQAKPGLAKAQTQLALAQAQKALAVAKDPSAVQPLSGPAHDAESDIIFKKRHADNPEDLQELTNATNRVERSANARWWSTVPSDERAQVLGNLKSLGIDPVKSTRLLGQGYSEQEIINMHQATQQKTRQPTTITPTPTVPSGQPFAPPSITQPTVTAATPTASNVHNETPATVDKSIQEVKDATKPLKWQDITPNFAPTESAKTRAQQSAQASAGLDYLGKYISNNLKYGGITSKITRPWLQDIYSSDPTKQAKAVNYYVAQAVKPELALLRIRIQGGQASARAMKALAPTILGTISVDMSNLPAKMQQRVQAKATEVLNEAAYQTELQTLKPNPNVYNPKIDSGQNISATAPATPTTAAPTTGTIRVRLPDGREGSVPAANLDKVIKMGAKRI